MKSYFTLLAGLLWVCSFAQQKADIITYIKQYKHVAIEEMVRTKIPASITMAQGILESGCGKSPLSVKANNHFGIKCKSEWTGEKYLQDDDEAQECFRVYRHAEASYLDHSDFLLTRFRYATLFELPLTDYKKWASGLKEVGYATNPRYAETLVTYIETYKLHELDKAGIAQIEEQEKLLSRTDTYMPVVAKAETKTIAEEPKQQATAAAIAVVAVASGKEEISVNGVRCVKATGEEDPLQIAFDYNIDYSFVMIFNDLSTGERFKNGENIFLQPKKNSCEQATYTVKPGESMRDISQRLGIKLRELYLKNLIKANEQVYAGETISLQERRTEPPRNMSYSEYLHTLSDVSAKSSFTKAMNTMAKYEVQTSDTLYSIAQKFNTTVEQLKALNNLESADLKPGQTLVVGR